MKLKRTKNVWVAVWHSRNALDGRARHIMNDHISNNPMTFPTREKARQWVRKEYGFIRTRPDLQAEPHGWRMPTVAKATLTLTTEPLR